jgi:hypothetical protein
MKVVLSLVAAASFAAAGYAVGFAISPKGMAASTQWPDIDPGLVTDFDFSSIRFFYEGRGEYWLEDNSQDYISTRQTALYVVRLTPIFSTAVGGGFWLSTKEMFWVYSGPGPWEGGPDWVTEFRPFAEFRLPLTFDTFSVSPVFRYQVAAYRNYEEPGQKYRYVEPELIFDYVFTDRWALEIRGRYWRGVGNDWADVGFLELGPRISW